MCEFGNGISMANKALQVDFDLVDVFWCATLEAARLDGVVDAGMRRHGGQAQSGAQANAVGSHLIHAVFHRGKAFHQRVSTGVRLVSQLLHQHFQLVKFGVAGCKVAKTMAVSIEKRTEFED
jgi:hypothetical protein